MNLIDLEDTKNRLICLKKNASSKQNNDIELLRQYDFQELLPYDSKLKREEVDLRTEIKEYRMLLNAALEAIHSLAQGDLIKFDSFVGENACQVRAAWIAIIASKEPEDRIALYRKITESNEEINKILNSTEIKEIGLKYRTLDHLLINEGISIKINFELYFVIQAFLLTEAKISPPNEDLFPSLQVPAKSDPKKLKRFGEISSTFAEKIIRKYRKFVATASVQFVREQAKQSGDKNLQEMLSDKFTINHNNHLVCTPMFWTYKSILFVLHNRKIPLILHAKFLKQEREGYRVIDEDWLLFQSDAPLLESPNLTHKNIEEIDPKIPALVIQGIVLLDQNKPTSKVQWRKMILSYPITTVILAGTADHPQYPNIEQDELIYSLQDHEYESYKSLAKSEGFTLENPTTFLIQHVYSSHVNVGLPT
jgi:hypothetical protein